MSSEREQRVQNVLAELSSARPRGLDFGRTVTHTSGVGLGGRTAATPQPSNGADGHLAAPRLREITLFHRSPEPMSAEDRTMADNDNATRRSNLPTPPREQSEDRDSLFVPEQIDTRRPRIIRSSHPLSNSWRPESPINGLGDRNRSPTPADGWEIMQTTITPDVALPSADSSFTSAAASQSFTSNETALTEPDREPHSQRRPGVEQDDDSESDDNPDIMRDTGEREATAQCAQEMYLYEIQSEEGLSRILRHRRAQAAEGNKFALAHESQEIELGFRLIDEALNSEEGLQRVFDISHDRPRYARSFEDWIFSSRRGTRRRRPDQGSDDEQPCPQPERRSTNEDAAREANAHVHDYFRRFTADSLTDAHSSSSQSRRASPPPDYEALPSDNAIETFISRDPPEPHPVSPPTARDQSGSSDLLLSGDEQDLDAVRRVVERLAQREDVPDEWWMSMGLNLSRTRIQSRSPAINVNAAADGALRDAQARVNRESHSRL